LSLERADFLFQATHLLVIAEDCDFQAGMMLFSGCQGGHAPQFSLNPSVVGEVGAWFESCDVTLSQ